MKPGIVFDLDGTLVDSASAIRAVGNAALAAVDLAPLTLAETIRCIGMGERVFIERALALRDASDAFDRAMPVFKAGYEAQTGAESPAYPGVDAALSQLAASGHPLAVCTNKPTVPAGHVLAARGWSETFGCVIGGDSLGVRKPDPAPLRAAMAALGDGPALYVGDSEVDAATAHAADVPFILFLPGYRQAAAETLSPVATFENFADLPSLIATLAARGGSSLDGVGSA